MRSAIYLCSGAKITRATAAGGAPSVLATRSSTNAITVDGTSVYWTDVSDGTVKKTAK